MKEIIIKYLIPALMIYVILMPHLERVTFQGGNGHGAQFTQIAFDGTFGIPVPAVAIISDDANFRHTSLELQSSKALVTYTLDSTHQAEGTVKLSTSIPAVSLNPQQGYHTLPYNLFAELAAFELKAADTSLTSVTTTTLEAVPSWNLNSLSVPEINALLADNNIPVTFDLFAVEAAIKELNEKDYGFLVEKGILSNSGLPNWAISITSEVEIVLDENISQFSLSYPVYPGFSEEKAETFASSFCSNESADYAFTAHHLIDFAQFDNLDEMTIKNGTGGAATCIEGTRTSFAGGYTISGPELKKNGLSEVLFLGS
jgi:hypothetical protein